MTEDCGLLLFIPAVIVAWAIAMVALHIKAQAAEIERLREENLQLRFEMTMIELDSFDAYDDWCLRGLPEEAIGFADRTHQRAKAVLLGREYDGD
jgi:hypothetical protein